MGVATEKRSARMDVRMTESEKALLERTAKQQRRTITSLFMQFIETLERKPDADTTDTHVR